MSTKSLKTNMNIKTVMKVTNHAIVIKILTKAQIILKIIKMNTKWKIHNKI